MNAVNRVQPGVPTGGQFAPTSRPEADLDLDAPTAGGSGAYRDSLTAEIAGITAKVAEAEDAFSAAAGHREQLDMEFDNGEWPKAHPGAGWGEAFEAEGAAEDAQEAAQQQLDSARTALRNAQFDLGELDDAEDQVTGDQAVEALVPRDGMLADYYAATDAKHFDSTTPGSTFTDPRLHRLEDVVTLARSQRGNLDGDDREALIGMGVPPVTMRPDARYLLVSTPGIVGVTLSGYLPPETPVRIARTKPGMPCVPVVQLPAPATTDVGTVILGPSQDDSTREIVYTAHPGLPIPAAADDRLASLEGQTVPLSQVRAAFGGETWLTVESASTSR